MLALANRDGVVECTLPGLAKMAEVSMDKASEAVRKLSQPDGLSRTKDNDGRRIEEVEGGWHLVNYDLYRWKSSPDEAADRQRRYRLRKKRAASALQKHNESLQKHNNVTKSNATHIAEAYIPPTPLSKEALRDCNDSHNSRSWEKQNQKPKAKSCPMPVGEGHECGKPLEPGERYCSHCQELGQRLENKYGKA